MEEQDTQPAETEPTGSQPTPPPKPVSLKRQGPRITHQDIKSMKISTAKEAPAHIAMLNKFKSMLTDTFGSFANLFSGKKATQCDMNGHTFPKGAWEGEFPRCTHCNKEIRSADEMGTR
jgi:hypothetical protein